MNHSVLSRLPLLDKNNHSRTNHREPSNFLSSIHNVHNEAGNQENSPKATPASSSVVVGARFKLSPTDNASPSSYGDKSWETVMATPRSPWSCSQPLVVVTPPPASISAATRSFRLMENNERQSFGEIHNVDRLSTSPCNAPNVGHRFGSSFQSVKGRVRSGASTLGGFVPLLPKEETLSQARNSRVSPSFYRRLSSSPFLGQKGSPTPSLRTESTIDSDDSYRQDNSIFGARPVFPRETSPQSSPIKTLYEGGQAPKLFTLGLSMDQATCKFITPTQAEPTTSRLLEKSTTTRYKEKSTKGDEEVSSVTAVTSTKSKKSILSPTKGDDAIRRSRIKTELCLHYINKNPCPFGDSCTYAHGEEELQLTKLMDLHRAGHVDIHTYRTKPCLTWISTGSCPFGKRCHALHDPRLAGTEQSWLPHTETQGNTIATDINVDGLHQKRQYTILHDNPFGSAVKLGVDDFRSVYNYVCNLKGGSLSRKKKRIVLSEHHKLAIAVKMRGPEGFQFKFRPQHIIFDELCMVLQKRAFRLHGDGVVEIPVSSYRGNSNSEVLAREIAFGPDCDPTVRGVGLWFNIAEHDIAQCTPQQAKRYRWKRAPKKDDKVKQNIRPVLSAFDTRDTFLMIRPMDAETYRLATAILAHRLAVVKGQRILGLRERSKALELLRGQEMLLAQRFESLKYHWNKWAWPISDERKKFDEETPVPAVDASYEPTLYSDTAVRCNSAVVSIWNSLVTKNSSAFGSGEAGEKEMAPKKERTENSSRLQIFSRISLKPDSPKAGLPHIKGTNHHTTTQTSSSLQRRSQEGRWTAQSHRCWQSLLLESSELKGNNEWAIVKRHFENARSRKVLTILQQ